MSRDAAYHNYFPSMRRKRTCLSRSTSENKRKRGQSESINSRQANSTFGVGCSSDSLSFQEAGVPEPIQSHYCGNLFKSTCCSYCQAYHWVGERESLCCKGKVRLDPLHQPPSEMIALFDVTQLGNAAH